MSNVFDKVIDTMKEMQNDQVSENTLKEFVVYFHNLIIHTLRHTMVSEDLLAKLTLKELEELDLEGGDPLLIVQQIAKIADKMTDPILKRQFIS